MKQDNKANKRRSILCLSGMLPCYLFSMARGLFFSELNCLDDMVQKRPSSLNYKIRNFLNVSLLQGQALFLISSVTLSVINEMKLGVILLLTIS